jgi:hypothetical protein
MVVSKPLTKTSSKGRRRARSRRSLSQLQTAVTQARSRRDKATAHYHLALFHDNNSREAEAIPHYLDALALGLPRAVKVQALAWLASSLHKTGSPERALANVRKSLALASDPQLREFLDGLERRVRATLVRSTARD